MVMANVMRRIFEPLCDATADLISDASLWPNDRIEIGTSTKQPNHFIIQTYATMNGSRVGASGNASVRFFSRLPERKEIGYGRWSVAQTDFNVMVIASVWGEERISFLDDAARLAFNFLVLRFTQQTVAAHRMAKFKELGEVPLEPDGWVEHTSYPLSPYQHAAAFTAIDATEGLAFFMEQGTGKTPTTIAVLMHEAKKKYEATGEMYRAIVVCPKNVKLNWQEEIHKFATVPGKCVVLRGGKLHRMKQLVDVADPEDGCYFSVAISSYESVKRTWEGIRLFEWDLGIADESDMFKSPWAKRSKDMMKLRDKCNKRLALTGTPFNNSILDLYYQLEWLGEGMSGFSDWKAFRAYYNKYANADEVNNYQGAKVLIGFKNLPILHERLARCAFRITKKEAMPSLPDKMYDKVEVTMSKDQRVVYASLARELAAELNNALNDDTNRMTVNNVLTKLLRLSQITSGFAVLDRVYNDDGEEMLTRADRIRWFDEIPKLNELTETLKNKTPDEKTIIWTCWVPTIEKIATHLTNNGIKCVTYFGGTSDEERSKAQRAFNLDPEVKAFIGNPAAGGVGMNLPGYDSMNPDAYTTNADHTIYYACNWSFRQRAQSEDRNHGRGRCRRPVRYTDYITPGTIDVEIMKAVNNKKATALEAQDVRFIMKRLLSFDPSEVED